MSIKTTNHLALDWRAAARLWLAQHDRAVYLVTTLIVASLIGLASGAALYGSITPPVTAQPTPPLPIMIIATARAAQLPAPAPVAPRLIVAFDQPNGIAFPDPIPQPDPSQWLGRWGNDWIEVAWQPSSIWIRTADLGANLSDVRPVPDVVIAPVLAVAPMEQPPAAAATPEPQQYTVTNVPTDDFYAPLNVSIEERQKLIGDDPNALACGGSSLCGGMTNAEAQAALDQERERQRNIQQHYVDPAEVQKQWIAEQWRQEHCIGEVCTP